MKVRAQIGMVLNLDKCIGCHCVYYTLPLYKLFKITCCIRYN